MTVIKTTDDHKPIGMAFVRFNRKVDAINFAEKNKTLTINGKKLE
jgi:hypothetical protein